MLFFRYCIFCMVLNVLNVHAQQYDDFADGNFTVNPAWQGDSSLFQVNATFQLQTRSNVNADTAYLSSLFPSQGTHKWEFWLRLGFSPSSSNYARIFLVSDQANLEKATNGLYLQLGESGSLDGIDLFALSNGQQTKLADGINGHCAAANNVLRIRVTYLPDSTWLVESDTTGGHAFKTESNVQHAYSFPTPFYSGVLCKYTASNSAKFYFDDVIFGIKPLQPLGVKPQAVQVIDSVNLNVLFNGPLDTGSFSTTQFTLLTDSGNPLVLNAFTDTSIALQASHRFIDNRTQRIEMGGLRDRLGFVIPTDTLMFLYSYRKPLNWGELLITEIMADPSPSRGLPEVEYVELYNPGQSSVDLQGLVLVVGNQQVSLPRDSISAKGNVLLCDQAFQGLFSGHVLGIPNFPSLLNTGTRIALWDTAGKSIHEVSYSDAWHANSSLREGGVALEMKSNRKACEGQSNWASSKAPLGGTPGKINSVYNTDNDGIAPEPLYVGLTEPDTLWVYMSEALHPEQWQSCKLYVDSLLLSPVKQDIQMHALAYKLPFGLIPSKLYQVVLSKGWKDCSGNDLNAAHALTVQLPKDLAKGDLRWNEIMFDPKPGAPEFFEVYTHANAMVDLQSVSYANWDATYQAAKQVFALTHHSILLQPHRYYVFTENRDLLLAHYPQAQAKQVIQVPWLGLSNSGDQLVLRNAAGQIIDSCLYNPNMHLPALTETQGVSLERRNLLEDGLNTTNWTSAAQLAGYATPTYTNAMAGEATGEGDVTLSTEYISPNGDLYRDEVWIGFENPQGHPFLSALIYNASGSLVSTLANPVSIGVHNQLVWDGRNNKREILPAGLYVLVLNRFGGNLKSRVSKHIITLVGD